MMGIDPLSVLCICLFALLKHEYLCDQLGDHVQILSEASFVWGRASFGFGADRIRTLVSMTADTSHMVVMGENGVIIFFRLFLIRAFSYL